MKLPNWKKKKLPILDSIDAFNDLNSRMCLIVKLKIEFNMVLL